VPLKRGLETFRQDYCRLDYRETGHPSTDSSLLFVVPIL
jgi:hypothetical protein